MNTNLDTSSDDTASIRRVAAKRTGISIPVGIAIAACLGLIFSFIFTTDGAFTMSPVALERFGTENMTFLNILVAGAFIGGTFGGASVFFDIKDWSMSKSFVIHFLTTMPVLFFFMWLNGWYDNSGGGFVSSMLLALVIYVAIYAISFVIQRRIIKKVNTQL